MIIDALSEMFIQGAAKKGLNYFNDPRSPHTKELLKTINQTIEEFAEKHKTTDKITASFFEKGKLILNELFSIEKAPAEYPFYFSQAIVDELLKFRFFENHSFENITAVFKKNPNILYKKEQVDEFLQLFHQKTQENETLKQLEINENFKNEIYRISEKQEQHFQLSQKSYAVLQQIKETGESNTEKIESLKTELKEILNAVLLSQKVNKIEVSGSKNIILQDINGSDIDISAIQNPEIQKYLAGFAKDEFKLYNKVFVYSTPKDHDFVKNDLIPRLQKANIPVHFDPNADVDEKDYFVLETIKHCRKTLVVNSESLANSEADEDFFRRFRRSSQDKTRKKLVSLNLTKTIYGEIDWPKQFDLTHPQQRKTCLNELANALRSEYGMKITEKIYPPLPDDCVDLSQMPYKKDTRILYGRQKELDMLDQHWENNEINILLFVAQGGVGKSALIRRWVEQEMQPDNFRGAQKVFAWSFYKQGTSKESAPIDDFINAAFDFFGVKTEKAQNLSAWDKGKILAKAINRQRTLLVLDGLEPMQDFVEKDPKENGKIKHSELQVLLKNLNNENKGLCLITSRLPLAYDVLPPKNNNCTTHYLEQISSEAASEILIDHGLSFAEHNLQNIAQSFGNHALAINLLGVFLKRSKKSLTQAQNIPDLPHISENKGRHARRVIAALHQHLLSQNRNAEAEILSLSGLFDRPFEEEIVIELLEKLDTLNFSNLSNFPRVLENLRRYQLFYPKSSHEEDKNKIDCHPLIREHFAEELKENHPKTWQQANRILYEYFKNKAPHQPDTLPQMQPLFRAVAHGCRAGMHNEAENDVFWERIRRGNEGFSVNQLGAFGSDLACLSHFFDEIWHTPAANITESDKAMVLSWAGFSLRAVGRTDQAIEAMEAALQLRKSKAELKNDKEDWAGSARNAGNISELALVAGVVRNPTTTHNPPGFPNPAGFTTKDPSGFENPPGRGIPIATHYAQQAKEYADRSEDQVEMRDNRAVLADALHHAGESGQALSLFREAEALQKQDQPEYHYLYSIRGFQYCDWLLSVGEEGDPPGLSRDPAGLGKDPSGLGRDPAGFKNPPGLSQRISHVLERYKKFVEWRSPSDSVLDQSLEELTAGKACLLAVQRGIALNLPGSEKPAGLGELKKQAFHHLNQAVEGLRKAGSTHHIPKALLARAAYFRHIGQAAQAAEDLAEVWEIMENAGFELYRVEWHLEMAHWAEKAAEKPFRFPKPERFEKAAEKPFRFPKPERFKDYTAQDHRQEAQTWREKMGLWRRFPLVE